MIDYKIIAKPELITTRRIVAKEIIEIDKQMEEIERDYCYLSPDHNDIYWDDDKAEECYLNLGKTKKYLKESLKTLNHKMAVFN